MNQRPPALLLGIDRLLGLQTARILWKAEVPVIGIADDIHSHYCRTRTATRIIPDAEAGESFLPFLQNLGREYGAKPVVIPCTDGYVWRFSRRLGLFTVTSA